MQSLDLSPCTRTNPYGARVCMKYTYFTRKGITKTHGCPNAAVVIIIIITEIVIRNRSEYNTQLVAYSRVIRFTFRKINVSFVTFNYKRVCTKLDDLNRLLSSNLSKYRVLENNAERSLRFTTTKSLVVRNWEDARNFFWIDLTDILVTLVSAIERMDAIVIALWRSIRCRYLIKNV